MSGVLQRLGWRRQLLPKNEVITSSFVIFPDHFYTKFAIKNGSKMAKISADFKKSQNSANSY